VGGGDAKDYQKQPENRYKKPIPPIEKRGRGRGNGATGAPTPFQGGGRVRLYSKRRKGKQRGQPRLFMCKCLKDVGRARTKGGGGMLREKCRSTKKQSSGGD